MSGVGGHCGKCGAPYYYPTMWHGITPPPASPTCGCWNTPQTITTTEGTNTTITRTSIDLDESYDIVLVKNKYIDFLDEVHNDLDDLSNANIVNVFDKVKKLKKKLSNFIKESKDAK